MARHLSLRSSFDVCLSIPLLMLCKDSCVLAQDFAKKSLISLFCWRQKQTRKSMRTSDANVSKRSEDKKRRRVCAALQPTAALLGSPSAALYRQSKSSSYFVVLFMRTDRLFQKENKHPHLLFLETKTKYGADCCIRK